MSVRLGRNSAKSESTHVLWTSYHQHRSGQRQNCPVGRGVRGSGAERVHGGYVVGEVQATLKRSSQAYRFFTEVFNRLGCEYVFTPPSVLAVHAVACLSCRKGSMAGKRVGDLPDTPAVGNCVGCETAHAPIERDG